jgi:hypothetical protein
MLRLHRVKITGIPLRTRRKNAFGTVESSSITILQ